MNGARNGNIQPTHQKDRMNSLCGPPSCFQKPLNGNNLLDSPAISGVGSGRQAGFAAFGLVYWLAVALLLILFVARGAPLRESVSSRIPCYTTSRIEIHWAGLIRLPAAEPRPVIPKLIPINYGSECREISITVRQSLQFRVRQWANSSVGIIWRPSALEMTRIGREKHVETNLPYALRRIGWERRSFIFAHNLYNNGSKNFERGAFTNILNAHNSLIVRSERQ